MLSASPSVCACCTLQATFNCENLFRRFEFNRNNGRNNGRDDRNADASFTLDQARSFKVSDNEEKSLTAAAILAVDADVLALQEVESLDLLDLFNEEYLASTYKYRLLVQGNDRRGINVAVLSRYPFKAVHTARFAAVNDGGVEADLLYKEQESAAGKDVYIFSRDCLRVDVAVPGDKPLYLYVNHFKSMMGGRDKTRAKRQQQSERVAGMLARDHGGPSLGDDYVIVCGDFNDKDQDDSGTVSLIRNPYLENVLRRLPDEEDRWTHYFSKEDSYSQLDFLLLSPALSQITEGVQPMVERRGQPKRASRYSGPRFEGVEFNRPKASDHCPVAIDIPFLPPRH